MRKFGFGSDTGIDLPFECDGRVPTSSQEARSSKRACCSEGEGRGYCVGDNIQTAIGQGLLAATPMQLATGYAAVANGGRVLTPQVVEAICEPGVPDGAPGFADLDQGTVCSRCAPAHVRADRRCPTTSASRSSTGCAATSPAPGSTARLRPPPRSCSRRLPRRRDPVAGKTGTAQGATTTRGTTRRRSPPSASTRAQPYTVAAYLEKAGYGSQGAAPVVKCMYLALSGLRATEPVSCRDPLDLETRRRRAQPMPIADLTCSGRNCYPGQGLAARPTERRWPSPCSSASPTRGSATSARAPATRAATSTGCCCSPRRCSPSIGCFVVYSATRHADRRRPVHLRHPAGDLRHRRRRRDVRRDDRRLRVVQRAGAVALRSSPSSCSLLLADARPGDRRHADLVRHRPDQHPARRVRQGHRAARPRAPTSPTSAATRSPTPGSSAG